MNRKTCFFVLLTLTAFVLTMGLISTQGEAEPPAKHSDVDFSMSCLECHTVETPDITADWEKGMHGQVNVGCFVCHGDGDVEFFPQPTTERCVSCHSAQEADYSKIEASTCFSCHNGHTLTFH